MKKMLMVVALILTFSSLVMAADLPKWEFFIGYSLLRADVGTNQAVRALTESAGSVIGAVSDSDSFSGLSLSSNATVMDYPRGVNLHGFEVTGTRNLNKWLGLSANISAHYGHPTLKGNLPIVATDYDPDADTYNGTDYAETKTINMNVDVTGKAKIRQYNFLVGPEFSYRKLEKFRPFVHALMGVSYLKGSDLNLSWKAYGDETDTYYSSATKQVYTSTNANYDGTITGDWKDSLAFTMALGGGLDYKINNRISARVIQLDYVPAWRSLSSNLTLTANAYDGSSVTETLTGSIGAHVYPALYNNLRFSCGLVFNF